jgi:hypothetical protein
MRGTRPRRKGIWSGEGWQLDATSAGSGEAIKIKGPRGPEGPTRKGKESTNSRENARSTREIARKKSGIEWKPSHADDPALHRPAARAQHATLRRSGHSPTHAPATVSILLCSSLPAPPTTQPLALDAHHVTLGSDALSGPQSIKGKGMRTSVLPPSLLSLLPRLAVSAPSTCVFLPSPLPCLVPIGPGLHFPPSGPCVLLLACPHPPFPFPSRLTRPACYSSLHVSPLA